MDKTSHNKVGGQHRAKKLVIIGFRHHTEMAKDDFCLLGETIGEIVWIVTIVIR